jgi:acyl dehydratase
LVREEDTTTLTRDKDEKDSFYVRYTTRDAILYALSLGLGDSPEHYDTDLPLVWEDHASFTVFPTLAATFPFWGRSTTAAMCGAHSTELSLPPFPPPVMQRLGLLPEHCLRGGRQDLADIPILHTWQSLHWRRPLPAPPATCCVRNRFVKVVPKAVGTFVTTELSVHDSTNNPGSHGPSCILQSTALLLGLDPESVVGWEEEEDDRTATARTRRPPGAPRAIPLDRPPDLIVPVPIPTNQALLYRLASGDTNAIHVTPTASPVEDCLLHGSATLGVVARVLWRHHAAAGVVLGPHWLRHLQARFTHPVLMGETITVQVWSVVDDDGLAEDRLAYAFRVVNAHGHIALDGGHAEVLATRVVTSKL